MLKCCCLHNLSTPKSTTIQLLQIKQRIFSWKISCDARSQNIQPNAIFNIRHSVLNKRRNYVAPILFELLAFSKMKHRLFTNKLLYNSQSVVKFEEQESQDRSAEKDSKLFHSTCSDLRKIFEQITELKKSNTEKVWQLLTYKSIN